MEFRPAKRPTRTQSLPSEVGEGGGVECWWRGEGVFQVVGWAGWVRTGWVRMRVRCRSGGR